MSKRNIKWCVTITIMLFAGAVTFSSCQKNTVSTTDEIISVKHEKAAGCQPHHIVVYLASGQRITLDILCNCNGVNGTDGSINGDGSTRLPTAFHIEYIGPPTRTQQELQDPNNWRWGHVNGHICPCFNGIDPNLLQELIDIVQDPAFLPCLNEF